MLWHLVQIDRQRDRTQSMSVFSSMAQRGLWSPSFNPFRNPTGLYMLVWELPTSYRMADLPTLGHFICGMWSCLCSKASSASIQQIWRAWQEWRWWSTMVMMVMCSICVEWVSYSPFLSTSLLFISPTPRLALNPPTPDLLSLGDLWKRERISEWVASQQDVPMQLSLRSHRAICLLLHVGHADKKDSKTPFQAIYRTSNIILLLVLRFLKKKNTHTHILMLLFPLSTVFNKLSVNLELLSLYACNNAHFQLHESGWN